MLGPTTREQQEALWDYGLNIGMAFQIVDDLLDFTGEEVTLGKPVGGDLREGKMTLPVIHLRDRGETRANALLRKVVASRDVTLEEWTRVMDINSTGVFLGTRAAIPAMRRAGGGSIVNISSQLGLGGVDNSSPQYQASKGAVRLLTKATAIQYAAEGIRANSVHPGPIETPMTEARRGDPEVYKLTVSRIPLGRYGQPEDVAYGVLYLASDESSYVTGSELVIDGGWTAQ